MQPTRRGASEGPESAAGVQGSIITGVLFVTFISWIPGHGASYLGEASNFPGMLAWPCAPKPLPESLNYLLASAPCTLPLQGFGCLPLHARLVCSGGDGQHPSSAAL